MEFLEALDIIFDVQYKGEHSHAHSRTAWALAEAVADGLMSIECAKNLMWKIGTQISISNDYYYNVGYSTGFDDAEEVLSDDNE